MQYNAGSDPYICRAQAEATKCCSRNRKWVPTSSWTWSRDNDTLWGGPEIFRRRNPAGGSRPLGAWAFFYSCCFLSCCLLPGQLRCEWLILQPCLSHRNGLKLPETMNQTLLWVVSVRYWVTAMREMTYTLSTEAITGFSFLKFWFCHEFKGHFFFFLNFSSPKGFYC